MAFWSKNKAEPPCKPLKAKLEEAKGTKPLPDYINFPGIEDIYKVYMEHFSGTTGEKVKRYRLDFANNVLEWSPRFTTSRGNVEQLYIVIPLREQ